jgi:hypothetical protein
MKIGEKKEKIVSKFTKSAFCESLDCYKKYVGQFSLKVFIESKMAFLNIFF